MLQRKIPMEIIGGAWKPRSISWKSGMLQKRFLIEVIGVIRKSGLTSGNTDLLDLSGGD
jgi:hypothetical protein